MVTYSRNLNILLVLFLPLTVAFVSWSGLAPFGRLALAIGQPGLAIKLLDDPYWKGVALYRLDRFEDAAATFRKAGRAAFFNRANALARMGHYPEAVAFYDAVLFYNPEDPDARVNRALVNALIDEDGDVPLNGKFIPEDAFFKKVPVNTEDNPLSTDYSWADNFRYKSVFRSGQVASASEEWLESLSDNPGRYLKLRIAAEHERKRRVGAGIVPGEDQW